MIPSDAVRIILPRFWRHEVGGKLAPSIERYLTNQTAGGPFSDDDLLLVRAYLVQWIDAPCWNPESGDDDSGGSAKELAELRRDCRALSSADQIHDWLMRALDLGIDPL